MSINAGFNYPDNEGVCLTHGSEVRVSSGDRHDFVSLSSKWPGIAGETDLREYDRQPTIDLSLPEKYSGDIDVMRQGEDDKPNADSSLGGKPSDEISEVEVEVEVESIPSTSETSSEGGPKVASDLLLN